jgi:hypothetical protein
MDDTWICSILESVRAVFLINSNSTKKDLVLFFKKQKRKRKSKSATRMNHSFFSLLVLWGENHFVGFANQL